MLSQDKVCLAVDGTDIERTHAVARDFRSCTRTVMVGPMLLMTYGLPAVRSFSELGMSSIIVDARLAGHQREVWAGITAAAALRTVRAITVQPYCGRHVLTMAAEAAANCPLLQQRDEPPLVLAHIPAIAYRPCDLEALGLRCRRKDYVLQLIETCYDAGLSGAIVEQRDVRATRKLIRRIKKENQPFIVLAHAQRGVQDYRVATSEEDEKVPGITDVLNAGAHHALFSMTLASHDTEWTADLITKELNDLREERRRRRRTD